MFCDAWHMTVNDISCPVEPIWLNGLQNGNSMAGMDFGTYYY